MTTKERTSRRTNRLRNPLVLILSASLCTAILFETVRVIADEWSEPGGVPRLIPYRGHLELDGAPVEGDITLSVSFYDAEIDGTRLWGPEIISATATGGDFSVMLGQLCRHTHPDPLTSAGVSRALRRLEAEGAQELLHPVGVEHRLLGSMVDEAPGGEPTARGDWPEIARAAEVIRDGTAPPRRAVSLESPMPG